MELALFCHYRNSTYCGYGFGFHTCNAYAKITIHRLTGSLIHCHSITHRIASNQGTHLTNKEVKQWIHTHGIQWSYCVLVHPRAADWRAMERPLEDAVTGPARCQALSGVGQDSQKAIYALNQCPTYGIVSFIARIHRLEIKG